VKKSVILYAGPLNPGQTCLMRCDTLAALGHDVTPVNSAPPASLRKSRRLISRIRNRFLSPFDDAEVGAQLLAEFRSKPYDMLWLDKIVTVSPGVLAELKRLQPTARLVSYNPDDPFGADIGRPFWRKFLAGLPLLDVCLVPRHVNVFEYMAAGARRAIQVVPFWGFSPEIHKPRPVDWHRPDLDTDVGFIGGYEMDRANRMLALASAGLQVRVWGDGWEKFPHSHPNLRIEGKSLWGAAYTDVLCSCKISLAFLRKANRDLHTSRSIEIPACRAFMMAERTSEHLDLFAEGTEAEFFETADELVDKCRRYLADDEHRRAVAAAGYSRCLSSGYDNASVIQRMIDEVGSVCNSG
jgi:spore maturation protein CgeB